MLLHRSFTFVQNDLYWDSVIPIRYSESVGVHHQSRGRRKDYPIEFLMEKNEM
jgi:hypothetical protein